MFIDILFTNPEGLDKLNVQNFIYNTLICKIFHMLYKWKMKWKKKSFNLTIMIAF